MLDNLNADNNDQIADQAVRLMNRYHNILPCVGGSGLVRTILQSNRQFAKMKRYSRLKFQGIFSDISGLDSKYNEDVYETLNAFQESVASLTKLNNTGSDAVDRGDNLLEFFNPNVIQEAMLITTYKLMDLLQILCGDTKIIFSSLSEAEAAIFGFDDNVISLFNKLRNNIRQYCIDNDYDVTEEDIAYFYTRIIGRLVYGSEGDSWKSQMEWDGTVGLDLIPEKEMFTNVLGLSEQEYKLLRYKVRVQNQILGAVVETDYDYFKNYSQIYNSYKQNMEQALGKNLSDEEFEKLWKEQYNQMSNASDYAHYNVTMAAAFATNYSPSIFDLIEWAKRSIANASCGGSDSDREDMAGWLGDATLKTSADNHVCFTQDDYKADLDAENVVYIMKKENISLEEAQCMYFNRINNGETRATIFKEHTSVDTVVSKICKRLGVNSLEEIKNSEPETYKFIMNLKNGSNELEDIT